jgi:hypothetical protein
MADKSMPDELAAVAALLEANHARRVNAAAEVAAAKRELEELLVGGYSAGMEVTEMARRARISRDAAHRTLKEAGAVSWKQKQAWAAEVMAHIDGRTHEQRMFRMFVNMLLLKALGSKPEDLPQSVAGVLARATDSMIDGGHPHFKPEYKPEVLRMAWPA